MTRWHLGRIAMKLVPDVRGKDRLTSAVLGRGIPASLTGRPINMRFGPGLTATVELDSDGSFADIFFAQVRPPCLVPVLEATLRHGDVFYDIGANIGVYSLWAGSLVGSTGRVYAFEPAERASVWLAALIAENRASNVEIVRRAVGDRAEDVELHTMTGASGLSSVVPGLRLSATGGTVETVSSVSFDTFAADHRKPTLVKIDVEGYEPAVVRGMAGVLEDVRPVVVFEAPEFGGGTGTVAVVDDLQSHDYAVFSLTRRGLVPFAKHCFSHNLLALHADHHAQKAALLNTRFRRNQGF